MLDAKATLGKGTFWDTREQVLWWVNIWGKQVHRFDPAAGLDRTWPVPEDVGCLALRETGGLVVSRRSGFFFFDPAGGRFDAIVDPETGRPDADRHPAAQVRSVKRNLFARGPADCWRCAPRVAATDPT